MKARNSVSRQRRAILYGSLIAASFVAPAHAQDFPSRPVRLIVGFAAGTGPDITARMLAQKLSELWGHVGVVVDNKPGGGGVTAAAEVQRAAPDGYTLLLGELGQIAIAPHTHTKLSYDPKKDFAPVSQVHSTGFILLVDPKQVPARNVSDFIEWGRKRPSGIFIATFGAGTPGHFAAHLFGDVAKLKVDTVHYRSSGDALVGLKSGDVQGVFGSVALSTAQINSGRLVGIGNTGFIRAASLPAIPTMKEQGFERLQFVSWNGVLAPAKTPSTLLDKISADIIKVLSLPATRATMEEAGQRVTGTTRAEFAKIIETDTVYWGKIVSSTGFQED